MDIKLTMGLISFSGVIIGALLQYIFTKHIENMRHLRDLKSNAYRDYLKCVCENALLKYGKISNENNVLQSKIADAKSRICLYGSNDAIESFSTFEKLGATLNTDKQQEAFTNMVAIMRKDSGSIICQHNENLQIVLFGYHKQSG